MIGGLNVHGDEDEADIQRFVDLLDNIIRIVLKNKVNGNALRIVNEFKGTTRALFECYVTTLWTRYDSWGHRHYLRVWGTLLEDS